MEQILTTFGVDWRLLLINGLNFGLLMAAMWYFLYAPVMGMLEDRRKKITKGVRDAEVATKAREDIEASRAASLAEAGVEADALIASARAAASQKEREIIARGEAAATTLLEDAEAQARELKAQSIEESKKEVAKLIVLGMEKAFKK